MKLEEIENLKPTVREEGSRFIVETESTILCCVDAQLTPDAEKIAHLFANTFFLLKKSGQALHDLQLHDPQTGFCDWTKLKNGLSIVQRLTDGRVLASLAIK